MSDFLYPYPPLTAGILLKRYKRFLADVELETGEVVTVHCANTGPMTGVCQVGQPVLLSKSDNPNRKHAYTWEAIQVGEAQPVWVGVNTALPNRVVKLALAQRLFPELGAYETVRPEVPYSQNSRVDFLLEGDTTLYVEVKNTTWAQGDLALFPDTVTTRGQKHLREMTQLLLPDDRPPELAQASTRAIALFFINRSDCPRFAPGDAADPTYGKLLREAVDKGLEILPCRFEVTPEGVRYLGLATLAL